MRAFLQVLRPSFLGLLLVTLGVLIQAGLFSVGSATFTFESGTPESSEITFGPGGLVTVVTDRGQSTVRVRWVPLALDLLLTYVLACIAAGALTRVAGVRQPGRVFGGIAAGAVAATFLVSIGLSKVYWGYFLGRPPVPREMGDIVRVASVTSVTVGEDGRTVVADAGAATTNDAAHGRREPYDGVGSRLLVDLEDRGLLPMAYGTALPPMPDPGAWLQTAGLLAKPQAGYETDSARHDGVVVDAVDASGGRLVVVGLRGGQVENDHYPYYEMVFAGAANSTGLAFVRGQRFFFDIAGSEGTEWYVVWPLLAMPGIFLAMVVFAVVRALWRWRRRMATSLGGARPE